MKYNGYDMIRQGRAASLIVSTAALSVAEGAGAGANYTVALNGQPQAAVTVAITSNNAAVTINAGGDTFGSSTTLSFSTLNWNVPQTVTVKAANDADLADGAATLSHVAAGAGSDFESASQSLPVTITDTTAADTELPPIIYNLNIRFDARRIALPEGHQATYRVRLAGQPAGRGSNIRIRSDNPDVQPAPDALRFTAANWNQWQRVSIAGDANHTDESATLAHYGPNRGYGSVLVSVTDTGDSRQAGDTTPPALTVVTEPGARWGVTVKATVPSDLAAHGEVRVSSAYRVPRTATGYNLGRSGAAQAIVSIAAPEDVPASGLTVCLPVARALAEEAGERPLTLLRYAAAGDDGGNAGWQPVSGAEHHAATQSVCAAGVTGFGPFAAAYVLP